MTLEHTTAETRNWAVIGHLSAFIQFVGIPAVIGPLVVWLLRKNEDPYSADQAKEALNFNISMLLWLFISGFLVLVLVGLILLPVLLVTWFVLVIVASIRASNGEQYRYPLTIRFIS